jgi:ADP-heptose:LPS heptosyltransferase
VVYNPHGDHILHGGFNNLDVTLYSMYPYFCKVKPDDIWIDTVQPVVELPEEYIVVHTTGGDARHRMYPHMAKVVKGLDVSIVQLGGPHDVLCHGALDLRGKLSFRESAWVMKHARAAVVVDSFLSHLAGAVGTDAVVLYGPAPARVVGPKAQGCKVVDLQPDMLAVCQSMSHCWGSRSSCQSPCIHSISPGKVRKALEGLLCLFFLYVN